MIIPGDSMGVEVFWKHLDVEQQTMIEEFVLLKIIEVNEQVTLTADLLRACTRLFHPSPKDLVRSFCVLLGYTTEEHELSLGDVRNDVNHDPLELFRPSKSNPQRSRYATLFVEDDYECSSLRKLFSVTRRTLRVQISTT